VIKHNQQGKTVEEETIVPADTETDLAEEKITGEATEKADEPTEFADEPTEVADEPTEVAEESTEVADEPTEVADESTEAASPFKPRRGINWSRVVAFGVLPGLALILALGAGYLKWQDNSVRNSETARAESVQAAKDTTIKMLSYKPDSVEKELNDARNLLTSEFRDQYTSLINDVVIPGAKEKQISAVASVPAVASVSAEPDHAVVLVFVNQTVVVGQDAPTDTASSVRVTLDKVEDRWLISKFDPV
jgi:Mce-associated membrane protein